MSTDNANNVSETKIERKPVQCVIRTGGNIADRGEVVGRTRKRSESRQSRMSSLAVGSYLSIEVKEGEDIDRVYNSLKVSANDLDYRPVFRIEDESRTIYVDREEGSNFVGWRNIEGGRRRRVTAAEQAAGTKVDEAIAAPNAVG